MSQTSFDPDQWQRARVCWRREWPGSAGLVSLRLDATVAPRLPGQYVQLACQAAEGSDVWGVRYLSLASPPGALPEVLVAPAEGDEEPGNPADLRVGDTVFVSRAGAGRLVIPHRTAAGEVTPLVVGAPLPEDTTSRDETLWLFAAGTGLAPLLSVCRAGRHGFRRVVLAHSVRTAACLAWADELRGDPDRLCYVPVVTRERDDPRIPAGLRSGWLERRAQVPLQPAGDVALLCGGVDMVRDTREALLARGLPDAAVITEF